MTTRARILKAALKLFTENGIDKTSTAKISDAVGLSSGALFVHFPSKQNLIEELYIERKKCSMQDFDDILDLEKGAEYNIKTLSRQLLSYYAEYQEDFKYILMVQNSPKLSGKISDLMKDEYSYKIDIIKSWIKSDEIKKMDPDLMVHLWWFIIIPFVEKMHQEKILKAPKKWLDFIWESLRK